MPDKPPVLVVEGEDELRELLLGALRVDGCSAQGVRDGDAALESVGREAVSVLVADLFLKGLNGLELLKRVKEKAPNVEVVISGRDAPVHSVVKVMKAGAFDFVPKPIDREYFLLVVGKAVGQQRLAHENQALKRISDLKSQRPPELT